MKKSSVILMLLVFIMAADIAWSKDDLTIEAGISIWNPSVTFNPVEGVINSSSILVGPKLNVIYDNFFSEISYLIPFSGFNTTVDFFGYSVSENIKISWLNLKLGYMVSPNIGIYAGYIKNSGSDTASLGTTSLSGTFSISGPGAGIIIRLPLGKVINLYANGSYNFGSYSNQASTITYTCNVFDVEGGLGYKFLMSNIQATLGWRYQTVSIPDFFGGSKMTFSGPFGSLVYSFR
ncbi:MAG: hypothetical protein HQK91_06790 [Nitrospirae bacterium]|nr:hypothetical protein [Nitrospirota bacterium]